MTVEFNEKEVRAAASHIAKVISDAFKAVAKAMREIAKSVRNGYLIYNYTKNPRVKHLALHARKARTRKKNYHRIIKENRRER